MKTFTMFSASGYTVSDVPLLHGAIGVEKLIANLPVLQFTAGETVPASGLCDPCLYIVLNGALLVSRTTCSSNQITALAQADREIRSGECIGELSIMDGKWEEHRIRAMQPTDVLAIDAGIFWILIDQSSGFARRFLMLPSFFNRSENVRFQFRNKRAEGEWPTSAVDGLFGLQNRPWLDQHLPRLIDEAKNFDAPLSILMMNLDFIDHFRQAYESAAMSEALRTFVGVLLSSLRPTDIATHYNDNKVVAVLRSANLQNATMVTQRIDERMLKTVVFADMREALPHITASFGVVSLAPWQSSEDLLDAASAALDRARSSAKDGMST